MKRHRSNSPHAVETTREGLNSKMSTTALRNTRSIRAFITTAPITAHNKNTSLDPLLGRSSSITRRHDHAVIQCLQAGLATNATPDSTSRVQRHCCSCRAALSDLWQASLDDFAAIEHLRTDGFLPWLTRLRAAASALHVAASRMQKRMTHATPTADKGSSSLSESVASTMSGAARSPTAPDMGALVALASRLRGLVSPPKTRGCGAAGGAGSEKEGGIVAGGAAVIADGIALAGPPVITAQCFHGVHFQQLVVVWSACEVTLCIPHSGAILETLAAITTASAAWVGGEAGTATPAMHIVSFGSLSSLSRALADLCALRDAFPSSSMPPVSLRFEGMLFIDRGRCLVAGEAVAFQTVVAPASVHVSAPALFPSAFTSHAAQCYVGAFVALAMLRLPFRLSTRTASDANTVSPAIEALDLDGPVLVLGMGGNVVANLLVEQLLAPTAEGRAFRLRNPRFTVHTVEIERAVFDACAANGQLPGFETGGGDVGGGVLLGATVAPSRQVPAWALRGASPPSPSQWAEWRATVAACVHYHIGLDALGGDLSAAAAPGTSPLVFLDCFDPFSGTMVHPEDCLRRIHALLQPGGQLVINSHASPAGVARQPGPFAAPIAAAFGVHCPVAVVRYRALDQLLVAIGKAPAAADADADADRQPADGDGALSDSVIAHPKANVTPLRLADIRRAWEDARLRGVTEAFPALLHGHCVQSTGTRHPAPEWMRGLGVQAGTVRSCHFSSQEGVGGRVVLIQ